MVNNIIKVYTYKYTVVYNTKYFSFPDTHLTFLQKKIIEQKNRNVNLQK